MMQEASTIIFLHWIIIGITQAYTRYDIMSYLLCLTLMYLFLQVTFYYFGSVLVYQTVACELKNIYSIGEDEIFKSQLVDFTAVILEDFKKFNKYQFGHNQKKPFERWTASGTFAPIKEVANSYVYRHSRHANFSSIQSNEFFQVWDILSDTVATPDWSSCVSSHFHDTLEPYFSDKEYFFLT